MSLSDSLIHLPGNAAVTEVSRDTGSQLRDIEGFGEVHLEHRAATGGEGEAILGGVGGLRYAAVAKLMVGGVGGMDSVGVRRGQIRFGKGWLTGAGWLLVAMEDGVGLEELNASTVTVHVAETADVHEDVETKAVACAEGSEKFVVTPAMFGS